MSRTRFTLGVALLAAALALWAPVPQGASAQSAPYTAYGVGLQTGQIVRAFARGVLCGSVTVDAGGNWLLSIAAEAPCQPRENDPLTFTLNANATTATATWRAGGAPANVQTGITLTLAPDTTPPVVSAPASITVTVAEQATSAAATLAQIAAFLAGATATDNRDPVVTVTHNGPATFPVGATVVTFSARDLAGNLGTATATVTVVRAGSGSFTTPPGNAIGVNTAVWGGGTIDQLVDAVSGGGNPARSVWVFSGGSALGYVPGAPAFVNAAFLNLFPGGTLPGGQIVILVR